jgi:hypothetical protein
VIVHGQPDADNLAALLAEGSHTVEEMALTRERSTRASLPETFVVLDELFAEGLLDEEPRRSGSPVTIAGPVLAHREDR